MSRSPSTRSPSPSLITDEQQQQQQRRYQQQAVATSRCNPFSIDYILSNAAAIKHEPATAAAATSPSHTKTMQPTHHLDRINSSALVDHLNMLQMNHQRAQLMAHLHQTISGTPQATQANATPATSTQMARHIESLQQALVSQAATSSEVLKAQQASNPNFFYFMACMLLQQQQQQQHQHHQHHQQQQPNLACQQAAKMVAQQQQQQRFQNQSPMDSLALLARLTGSAAVPSPHASPGAKARPPPMGTQRSVQSMQKRHQPYPLPPPPPPPPVPVSHMSQLAPPPPPPPHLQHPFNHHLSAPNVSFDLRFPAGSSLPEAPPPPPPPRSHQKTNQDRHLGLSPSKSMFSPAACNLKQHITSKCTSSYVNQIQQQQQHQVQRNHSSSASSSGPIGEKLDNLKPAHSYIGLIGMCILSQPDKRMVLNDIYQYILDHYPYYRNRGSGWRNSVRHNLSLNECFQKAGRAANGKGHYWTIHPANMEDFMNGDFRRRRAQRKVRRWNNMDVPSDESDDESMEDATRPPLPEHFKRSIEMHKQLEAESSFVLLAQQRERQQQQLGKQQDLMARAAAMAAISAAAAAAAASASASTTTTTAGAGAGASSSTSSSPGNHHQNGSTPQTTVEAQARTPIRVPIEQPALFSGANH